MFAMCTLLSNRIKAVAISYIHIEKFTCSITLFKVLNAISRFAIWCLCDNEGSSNAANLSGNDLSQDGNSYYSSGPCSDFTLKLFEFALQSRLHYHI